MSKGVPDSELTLAELRRRLQEAEETLDAIRMAAVDAVVVDGVAGQQVYTLESPDQPFRLFVEQMQEGAVTLDGEGTVLYCNPFFANLLGDATERVIGQRLHSFIAPDATGCLSRILEGSETKAQVECLLRRSDGSDVPVQLAFGRLPSSSSPLIGVVVADLTAREQARRAEIERHAAEEANAARDQFLAIVSHELRTPLNSIMGWAQLLARRRNLPEAALRGVEIIERNCREQAKLIDDLLDVSRVLAGKLRLDREPVELSALVTTAIGMEQPLADSRQIQLVPRIADEEIWIEADAARLRQVLGNLLGNAIKYTGSEGEVVISVAADSDSARIEICDNGVGIAPDFLPKVFGLFEQAVATGSRRAGGLGLGLAIVKQLVELHGGTVTLESAGPGKGTTARLVLPRLPDQHRMSIVEARPASGALTGLTILLVEDEPQALEMMQQMLEATGARVVVAASAAAALGLLEQEPVDLLVSDIGLPDEDGYELIGRIRAAGRSGRELPAVALTAYASRDDQRRALLAGYQIHLAKPADYDELYAAIAGLAGRTVGVH